MSEPFELDLSRVVELAPRYAIDGPRYTSYPTAPVWSEDYAASDFRADLAAAGQGSAASQGLSLYVHIPYCESLCHFCACNKVITRDHARAEPYLASIEREVAAVRAALGEPRPVSQLHWGGGTPTWLDPDEVRRLFRALNDAFPMREGAEISIEVDPRVTHSNHLDALVECGFNRISMGVQDFEPRVQEAIRRIQPAADTAKLVEEARDRGFGSVNFDLIYGLPYQTVASFERTLDQLFEIGPDRIALYSYAHVTWLAKQQRGFERVDLPDAAAKLEILLTAIRRFQERGYQFIGLDHFAKPEDELAKAVADRTLRRNFMGHTTQAGVDLIGFGPSAISELSGSYAQSQREVPAWQEAVDAGGLATLRGHRLSPDDQQRRWVIGRLLCHGVVRAEEFAQEFGGEPAFNERFASELQSLAQAREDGLVEIEPNGSLTITPVGRLLVRNIAMAFDAYLPAQRQAGNPIFSKTV